MSMRYKQLYESWCQLEASLARTHTYKGQELTALDSATWVRCLILLGLLCEDLSLMRIWNRLRHMSWISALAEHDVNDVVNSFKEIGQYMRNLTRTGFELDGKAGYKAFKQSLTSLFPVAAIALQPIDGAIKAYIRTRDVSLFDRIYQLVEFLGRACLDGIPTEGILEEFVEVDENLPDITPQLAGRLPNIVSRWLSGFVVDHTPHHGSGATRDAGTMLSFRKSGNHSLTAKYLHLVEDEYISETVRRYAPALAQFLEYPTCPLQSLERPKCLQRYSKVTFVPKSSTKKRTIAMEPTTSMFWGQAVKDSLYSYIDNHHYLSKHIRLFDQSFNANLALEGSQYGSFATIDLSHASDSVGMSLVESLFGNTPLWPWLSVLRSTETRLPKCEGSRFSEAVVTLRKFATMGSPLTFPVETLIFAAICEEAQETWSKDHREHRLFTYFVYGDDIVVEWELVPHVMRRLKELGFEPNMSKSFTDLGVGQFRESCGMEALSGVDVTPVRIPRAFTAGSFTDRPDGMGSYLQLANVALLRGFRGLRHYVIRKLLELPKKYRPLFVDLMPGTPWFRRQLSKESSGVWTLYPTDRAIHRSARPVTQPQRPSYQRHEVYCGVAKRRAQWEQKQFPRRLREVPKEVSPKIGELTPGIFHEIAWYHYWVLRFAKPLGITEGATYIGPLGESTLSSERRPQPGFITSYNGAVNFAWQSRPCDSTPAAKDLRELMLRGEHVKLPDNVVVET